MKLEHVHAALTRWFDADPTRGDTAPTGNITGSTGHADPIKPYSFSPVHDAGGQPGVEVGLLTAGAEEMFAKAATRGTKIRLGNQIGTLSTPRLMKQESWQSLNQASGATTWAIDFVTPTTFRRGTRSAPWPAPSAVLHGLSDIWLRWGGQGPRALSHQQADTVWVSDIDGKSHTLVVSNLHLSGFVGRINYRCNDKNIARMIDPLFRLADYSGIGTGTAKGLGVTRVVDARHAGSARTDRPS